MPKAAGLGPCRESRNFWLKFSFLTLGCGGGAVHAAPRPLPDKSGTEGVAGVEPAPWGVPWCLALVGAREAALRVVARRRNKMLGVRTARP